MTTIQTYLYANILEVQFQNPGFFTTRNRAVYARTIKIYRGIDNTLQFVAKNQDQKPVNLSGYAVQGFIQDHANQLTLEAFPVIMSNAAAGLGTFTLKSNLINSLTQAQYKLTFKTINQTTNAEQPLYSDQNYTVPIELVIEDAYYSSSLPDVEDGGILIDGGTI